MAKRSPGLALVQGPGPRCTSRLMGMRLVEGSSGLSQRGTARPEVRGRARGWTHCACGCHN